MPLFLPKEIHENQLPSYVRSGNLAALAAPQESVPRLSKPEINTGPVRDDNFVVRLGRTNQGYQGAVTRQVIVEIVFRASTPLHVQRFVCAMLHLCIP